MSVHDQNDASQGGDKTKSDRELLETLCESVLGLARQIIRIDHHLSGEAAGEGSDEDDDPSDGPDPRLALLDDGRIVLIVEDDEGRDFTGRVVVKCVMLTPQEQASARRAWSDGAGNAAAALLGAIPKRK